MPFGEPSLADDDEAPYRAVPGLLKSFEQQTLLPQVVIICQREM